MICIFCIAEHQPTIEHVFPLAIGGTITTDRLCVRCNSTLGSRVDAALNDFFPIRMRRAKLDLAGNSGEPPAWHELFHGEAKLVGSEANRVRTTFDKASGKLDTRQLYHAANVVMPDGTKTRQITIDARDKVQLPTIIKRERKRHGLPPLTHDQLAFALSNVTYRTIENPLIHKTLSFSFAYLRHAMFKIAYELAFLWLGESYLDDSLAVELREAICKEDVASTDHLTGYVGEAPECDGFRHWNSHEAHHLAYVTVVANCVFISVRVFDLYAASVAVSKDASRYFQSSADASKCRFLAIDSVSGRTIDIPFDIESRRMAVAMSTHRRPPPFPDPLEETAAA